MSSPGVHLHQFYSVHLTEKIDAIFGDFSMIDTAALESFMTHKGTVHIIPRQLIIDLDHKQICITGFKLDKTST
jgi:hypothetical protein